jgi:hypothetical protein
VTEDVQDSRRRIEHPTAHVMMPFQQQPKRCRQTVRRAEVILDDRARRVSAAAGDEPHHSGSAITWSMLVAPRSSMHSLSTPRAGRASDDPIAIVDPHPAF